MESWSFPPEYDNATLPNLASRYWFPERETMDPGAREAAIVVRLREVMQYAYANAPFTATSGTRSVSIPITLPAWRILSGCRW
jgi:phenylacetate-CoA ligase